MFVTRSCNEAGRIWVGRPSERIVEEEQGIRNPLALRTFPPKTVPRAMRVLADPYLPPFLIHPG
jgi:hypothetical protein